MSRRWYRKPDAWLSVGLLLAALAVYGSTMSSTIDFWDCGEFITVSHIVGVPHQPGTPLYVLVGRVFVVLFAQSDLAEPSFSAARAVNFMSAVFSALAVVLVYLIIVRVARRADPDTGWLARLGGLVGALFLLFSDTAWINAIEGEVYGLAAFMMALLTWLALIWYDERHSRRSDWLLLLLIYLCGLGVGFHLGSLLVYPAIFAVVWLATDRRLRVLDLFLVSAGLALFLASTTFITDAGVLAAMLVLFTAGCLLRAFWPRLRHPADTAPGERPRLLPFALFGLLLFVAGLSVHAVLMIRAGAVPEPAINQTVPSDFETLKSVLRREQYPPINPLERKAPLSFQYAYYYDFLLRQFSFLPHAGPRLDRLSVAIGPLLLALLGLAHVLRRARPLAWLLVLGYLINADGLILYLNFTANEVRERDYFYFAAFQYAAMFIGLGTVALLRWTSGPLGPSQHERELAASPPPPGRPFRFAGAVWQLAVAFALALVLMALVPGAVKERWLGLFLFGGAFVGLGLGRRLGAAGRPAHDAAPTWSDLAWSRRLLYAASLLLLLVFGGGLLLQFAAPPDQVFVLGLYAALAAGMLLCYGERRSPTREVAPVAWPAPARADRLSWLAGGVLILLAALPAIGSLDPGAHRKWFTHDRSQNRIAHEYAYNILAGLDRDAIIFTNGDNDTFPIWYLQEVEHVRRDVTVVNLSLINLPWYIKQLKRLATPLDLTFSDDQIDRLRPTAYRDRDTGEVVVWYVRDYVVKDIIDANLKRRAPRPIFFAVTIPRENMDRYYPFLQMEGLAYRLTPTRGRDDLPETDPDRLLANLFAAYRLDALTTGDTETRQRVFAEQAGWSFERPVHEYLTQLHEPPPVDYAELLPLIGENRIDVFRDANTANLLGNYPASIARAGYAYLTMAEGLRLDDGAFAPADTVAYDELTDLAMAAYELALRFDPYNILVAAGYYPALLLERHRTEDALAYLETIHNRLPEDIERSAVLSAVRGLMTLDRTPQALAWLDQRIAAHPSWRLGYELIFRVHEALGEVGAAARVVERWREVHGEDDPVLRRQLEVLRGDARLQEDERREERLRESGLLPEGP